MDSTTLAALGIVAAFFALAVAASEIIVQQMRHRRRYRERLSGIARMGR
jgi:hypothetical protein